MILYSLELSYSHTLENSELATPCTPLHRSVNSFIKNVAEPQQTQLYKDRTHTEEKTFAHHWLMPLMPIHTYSKCCTHYITFNIYTSILNMLQPVLKTMYPLKLFFWPVLQRSWAPSKLSKPLLKIVRISIWTIKKFFRVNLTITKIYTCFLLLLAQDLPLVLWCQQPWLMETLHQPSTDYINAYTINKARGLENS